MHRMTGLLLLLWAGATVSSMLDLQKRIINGYDCVREYHVKLVDKNDNFLCGGSLISDEWILTAAHCDEPVLKAVMHPYGGTPEEIADHVPCKDKDSSGKERTHDIMLLKLRKKVTNPHVNLPACGTKTPPSLPLRVKDEVEVAGHTKGTIGPNGEKVCGETAQLQCATADIISCDPFVKRLKSNCPDTYDDTIFQHMFCAQRANVDTCGGDSGGGVVKNDVIYGVHVRSAKKKACANPMGYMDVCGYKVWIETKTGLKFP